MIERNIVLARDLVEIQRTLHLRPEHLAQRLRTDIGDHLVVGHRGGVEDTAQRMSGGLHLRDQIRDLVIVTDVDLFFPHVDIGGTQGFDLGARHLGGGAAAAGQNQVGCAGPGQ
ncbi:Uncharacterised protein [Mycobacteroides abscessus]|nr:Uncharacterised protein [Mycobacteroides abscessus]SHW44942.1 Uncharacterised protein [Mycobacteroides abscessus subsp. abscessus]SLJ54860.1 Uncharacterised protein [Mycobacteroides abscessus subsp. abscessus]